MARRSVEDLEITCPAGAPVGEVLAGSGCYCRITRRNVATATDPSTLGAFCTFGYQDCPAWVDDKHRIAERRARLAEAA